MGNTISSHIDIRSFPDLYENANIDAVDALRKELNSKDKSILSQEAIESSVDDFLIFQDQCRYRVISDGVKFELLLIRNNSDKLYVSLTSNVHKFYPRFMRWSYAKFLKSNFLCIDDPMFETYRGKCHRWYYGTSDKSYLLAMIPIILNVISLLKIKNENVIFLGSSAGAYASLYLANRISGTNAFALSPQIVPGMWRNGKYLRKFEKELGINLLGDDVFDRNKILLTNTWGRFFIAYNYCSAPDRVQLDYLCKNQNINEIKYGITKHRNIFLWIHLTDGYKKHSNNPELIELFILQWLLDQDILGKDIGEFNGFIQIINEYGSRLVSLEDSCQFCD